MPPGRLNRAARWVKTRFPRSYDLVRPLGRALLRLRTPARAPDYWEARKHFRYYAEVIRLAQKYVPRGGTVIDVGARGTGVLTSLDGFSRRVMLDLEPMRPRPGIDTVQADFMEYRPPARFDLVLCLQVLEHLEDPAPFARRLFDTGDTVIISVPFRWPEGVFPLHVQDPVEETKLERWTGRVPVETLIVTDDRARMIAVYTQSASATGIGDGGESERTA
jgi:hypothetical protein